MYVSKWIRWLCFSCMSHVIYLLWTVASLHLHTLHTWPVFDVLCDLKMICLTLTVSMCCPASKMPCSHLQLKSSFLLIWYVKYHLKSRHVRWDLHRVFTSVFVSIHITPLTSQLSLTSPSVVHLLLQAWHVFDNHDKWTWRRRYNTQILKTGWIMRFPSSLISRDLVWQMCYEQPENVIVNVMSEWSSMRLEL